MDDKKPVNHFERNIEVVIILLIIFALMQSVFSSFSGEGISAGFEGVAGFILSVSPFLTVFFAILTIVLIILFLFFFLRLREVKNDEYHMYKARKVTTKKDPSRRLEWDTVIGHRDTENEAEWRVAVLEADRILSRILTEHGYGGETLADQLKSIPKGEYRHLQGVWEAHKVRNMIAHEGSEYALSARETKRVIGLYEIFFKELGDL